MRRAREGERDKEKGMRGSFSTRGTKLKNRERKRKKTHEVQIVKYEIVLQQILSENVIYIYIVFRVNLAAVANEHSHGALSCPDPGDGLSLGTL